MYMKVSFFQRHNGRTWNIAKTSEKTKEEVKGQGEIVVHQYADLSPEADNQKRDNGVEIECHFKEWLGLYRGFFKEFCLLFLNSLHDFYNSI